MIGLIREIVKDRPYQEWLLKEFYEIENILEIKIKQELTERYLQV